MSAICIGCRLTAAYCTCPRFGRVSDAVLSVAAWLGVLAVAVVTLTAPLAGPPSAPLHPSPVATVAVPIPNGER